MSALWMIGLLVAIMGASAFALSLCRAAALSDRDIEFPRPEALLRSTDLENQAEGYEIDISQLDEHPDIYLKQIGTPS